MCKGKNSNQSICESLSSNILFNLNFDYGCIYLDPHMYYFCIIQITISKNISESPNSSYKEAYSDIISMWVPSQ